MSFDLPRLANLQRADVERFQQDGFLIVEGVLSSERVEALRESFPRLFAGKFDTGIYPDEWYWREGMSLPDVTRHMANAWKADLTVARLALSADIGCAAAALTGWSGVRLGQDTIWWKVPRTKAVALHQDSSFMDFLDPPRTITCWWTLDDTHREVGTLEYVAGSHRWPLTPIPEGFHAPDDYRALMKNAARIAGVADPEPFFIEIPAGSCVFHAGEIWHGSAPNAASDRMRRSIGIHMMPADARFSDRPGGYIYRRYQRTDDPNLDESYFPILWTNDGHRTPWIEGYCKTGKRSVRG
jgi:ectoine hydroxylase-related dioxygenase (phytanoyl-CoA dioxygenase family)